MADEATTRDARRRRLRLSLFAVAVTGLILAWVAYAAMSSDGMNDPAVRRLFNTDPDFNWIPNDVYGHVHDELWEKLVAKMAAINGGGADREKWNPTAMGGTRSNPPAPRLDARTIPILVALMSSTNLTGMERIRKALADPFKGRVHDWIYPYNEWQWGDPVARRHIAAMEGFTELGTNAEPALPALSNLLMSADWELPLDFAIASMGPRGAALLTNALTSHRAEVREPAALALGLEWRQRTIAIPALLDCVRRGVASYQVLGALGRLECDDPRLIPLLIAQIRRFHLANDPDYDEDMALLLLGLAGERARAAAPFVETEYHKVEWIPEAVAARRFYRRILTAIAPDRAGQLPPPDDRDELGDDWP